MGARAGDSGDDMGFGQRPGQVRAKLVVQPASGRRREYELGESTSVGRHPMQTIQVLDPQVSKEHLVIGREGGAWFVQDLGSLNGTTVNGKALQGRAPLRHRDRIVIGQCEMTFLDARGEATGRHEVTIGDAIESSIYKASGTGSTAIFLPADQIHDVARLREDYEKLRLASEVSKEMTLELRQSELLPRLLDILLDLFKADRGVILLTDEETGELEPMAAKSRGRGADAPSIALSKTILNKVMSERSALLTSDAQRDQRFSGAQSVIISGIRSTMCAPLLGVDNRVIGVIHLDSLYRPGAFSERDLEMLQSVAHQAAVAIENAHLAERLQLEAVTRQKFQKMLSPNLVERVISGDLRIEKGGHLRTVTVMFTDIRGFTALSQAKPPQEIVKMLNEYFEAVVDIVFDFDGTLDKYIGDSVMAVWGAPADDPEHAQKAVQAAVEIQRAMVHFNELRRLDGLNEIHTGIGIDTGEIVVGYMGSSKTMSYTVIGESVNLASRLCASARGGEILISQRTRAEVGNAVESLRRPPLKLKGFARPVENFAVVDEWSQEGALYDQSTESLPVR